MLSALLSLAQFAPSLIRFLGGGDNAVQTAEKVVNIATSVSGTNSVEEAISIFSKNQQLAHEFNTKVLEQGHELDKLFLADAADARKRDAEFLRAGTRNYRADSLVAIAFIVILSMTYWVWNDSNLSEFAKGIVTLILGRFMGYLDGIYQFEFGSTRSNRAKDSTIEHLAKGGK